MITTAYILAGGKSSRMGEDKGLKPFNGTPLVKFIIDLLVSIFPAVKIVTSHQAYKQFGLDLISDIIPNKGPMGGIYTALMDAQKDVFILSCDMPFINSTAIEYLLGKHREEQPTVAQFMGRIQPLFGVYTQNSIQMMEEKIKNNELKMHSLIQELGTKLVEMEEVVDQKVFLNINTQEEFNQIEKQ